MNHYNIYDFKEINNKIKKENEELLNEYINELNDNLIKRKRNKKWIRNLASKRY